MTGTMILGRIQAKAMDTSSSHRSSGDKWGFPLMLGVVVHYWRLPVVGSYE